MLGAAVLPAFTVSIEGVLATLLPPDRVEISSSLLGIGLQLPQASPATCSLVELSFLIYPPQLQADASDLSRLLASLTYELTCRRRRAICPAPRL